MEINLTSALQVYPSLHSPQSFLMLSPGSVLCHVGADQPGIFMRRNAYRTFQRYLLIELPSNIVLKKMKGNVCIPDILRNFPSLA